MDRWHSESAPSFRPTVVWGGRVVGRGWKLEKAGRWVVSGECLASDRWIKLEERRRQGNAWQVFSFTARH